MYNSNQVSTTWKTLFNSSPAWWLLLFPIFINCISCGQSTTSQTNGAGPEPREIISDSTVQQLKKQKEELAKKMSAAQITYFINHVGGNKFGYSIFIDGQMYIEQKSIPAVEGNTGFDTAAEAEKIAKLVIEKIKQGEVPPTISVEDLKANGVSIHL